MLITFDIDFNMKIDLDNMDIPDKIDLNIFNCKNSEHCFYFMKLYDTLYTFKNYLYNNKLYKNKYATTFDFINFLKVVLTTDDIDINSKKYLIIKKFIDAFDVDYFSNLISIVQKFRSLYDNCICDTFDEHIHRNKNHQSTYSTKIDCKTFRLDFCGNTRD